MTTYPSKLTVLDLFSGIGGFSLGLERTGGFETVAFCEICPKARQVLRKHWQDVPIYEDVKTLTDEQLEVDNIKADVITGGFPCVDISQVRNRTKKRINDDKTGLYHEIIRITSETRPLFCIMENVPTLRRRGLQDILGELSQIGYDAEWHCIPASSVGAPHRRDRVWIIAYSNTYKGSKPVMRQYAEAPRMPKHERSYNKWSNKPESMGVAHGIPRRMDRLKQLGNSVVPQIPELIGNAILEANNV